MAPVELPQERAGLGVRPPGFVPGPVLAVFWKIKDIFVIYKRLLFRLFVIAGWGSGRRGVVGLRGDRVRHTQVCKARERGWR